MARPLFIIDFSVPFVAKPLRGLRALRGKVCFLSSGFCLALPIFPVENEAFLQYDGMTV